jgi:hypothetical protein
VLENLSADQLITVNEPALPENWKPAPAVLKSQSNPNALFTESAASRGLKHVDTLRPFDEFSRQRLLPRRLNGMGPGVAVADVNGDGVADIFISGTAGQAGELFLGKADGTYQSAPSQPWADAAESADVNAVFADLNGDGAPDLIVVAGGVEHPEGDALLNDRVYLNDGHGGFSLAPAGTIPADGESTRAIAVADFDGDKRPDVFIGGRVVPGHYPQTPRSFLYHNVDGKLVDVTDELAPGLRKVGMVTAAAWADIDGDKRPDLVLTLEWGPVAYFHNTGHGFENWTEKAGLAGLTGWWSGLAIADVNGDGRPDLIAGNAGLNTKYHASATEPTMLFAGDLDGSGRETLIEAQYENGGLYPLRGRSKLAYVFPWMKKKFPTFKAYAAAQVTDIFDRARLDAAQKLSATELASGVFMQRANGTFEFKPLPQTAQLGPINAIVAGQFCSNHVDLYCVGNNFGPEPNTGRFDGSLGVLLRGDGQGDFTPCSIPESGLAVKGDARAAAAVPLGSSGKSALLVARCDGPVQLFVPTKR